MRTRNIGVLLILTVAVLVLPPLPAASPPAQAQADWSYEDQLAASYQARYNDYIAANCPGGGCEEAALQDMQDHALRGVNGSYEQLLFFGPSEDCYRSCINIKNAGCLVDYNSTVIKAGSVAFAAALVCANTLKEPVSLSLCLAAVVVIYEGAVAAASFAYYHCRDKAEYECREKCDKTLASCVPSPYIISWCDDYNYQTCQCDGTVNKSPILIDLAHDGFSLSDVTDGVRFDMTGDGNPLALSWTRAGSDDAFLALDSNSNGRIDSGRELFGNFTPQPIPANGEKRNGFLALAQYDGNGDGVINNRDVIWASLKVWRDTDHNGASVNSELQTLDHAGITGLELRYKENRRRDRYGNWFRYQAKVLGGTGRLAWDVIFKEATQ